MFFRLILIIGLLLFTACTTSPPPATDVECQTDADCMVGGCSSQLCGTTKEMQDIVTTCEWKGEYACYKLTNCLCIENKCAWKETPEFLECKAAGGLQDKPKIVIEPQIEAELDLKRQCIYAKGSWKEFLNGCADTCLAVRTPEIVSCAQVITSSCDCGPDRCWNGETCEPN